MANFKRNKTKRNVRCTMCTTFRWMGNSKDRLKMKTARAKNVAGRQIQEFSTEQ